MKHIEDATGVQGYHTKKRGKESLGWRKINPVTFDDLGLVTRKKTKIVDLVLVELKGKKGGNRGGRHAYCTGYRFPNWTNATKKRDRNEELLGENEKGGGGKGNRL